MWISECYNELQGEVGDNGLRGESGAPGKFVSLIPSNTESMIEGVVFIRESLELQESLVKLGKMARQ